jgi:hypothetical protein
VISPVDALLIIPGIAIPVLGLVRNYRVGAALNVVAARGIARRRDCSSVRAAQPQRSDHC